MTKIEFTVVVTETNKPENKANKTELIALKNELIKRFGRLSVQECKGEWINEGKTYYDDCEIWTFFTDSKDCADIVDNYAKEIKRITLQLAQLYTITDGETKPHFL